MIVVDAYVDLVAVERATRGDAGVWAALTPPEKAEALLRVRRRRLAEQAENAEWAKISNRHKGCLPYERNSPQWLVDVARAAGYRSVQGLLEAARDIEISK